MAFGPQDVLATMTALGALAIIVRRIAGTVKPAANPGCANCPMVKGAPQR